MNSTHYDNMHFLKFRKYPQPHLRPWFESLENGLAEVGFRPIICPGSRMTAFTGKLLQRGGLLRRLATRGSNHAIVPMLHLSIYRVFPKCRALNLVPYCLDVWEPELHLWQKFFEEFSIERAFFSSSESCNAISQQCPWLDTAWIPEGIDLNDFFAGDVLQAREIDVLELGRKHAEWHNHVTEPLKESGIVHLYEQVPGSRVFSDNGLAEGLAKAKISVCFPSSITHPERSGSIETTTSRYFQSMASRCIVLGHAPKELIADFGYNPVIEADFKDPVGQIRNILQNVEAHQPLVERNRRSVERLATWAARFQKMADIMGLSCDGRMSESEPRSSPRR